MTAFRFDAKAALHQARKSGTLPTVPTVPTDRHAEGGKVGTVGTVGTVRVSDPEMTPDELARDIFEERTAIRELCGGQDRADGLVQDAAEFLDRLRLYGPSTYGAMASTMGWGATRAWRAEAKLSAAGLISYREGLAVPEPSQRNIEKPDG